MRLVLWRHGHTDFNGDRRIQGWLDTPLSAAGAAAVPAAANAIAAAVDPDVIISSDLQRASATAAVLAQLLGIELRCDARLRERRMGQWEGRRVDELDPAQWQRALTDPTFAPPEGEATAEVAARMREVVDELVPTTDCAVIVSHGGALRVLAADLLGIQEQLLRKLDNVGWAEVAHTATGWRVERWNR
ncbi:MAG: histidine phosphatase family protein [Corynebacterium sp.]|nr:histidine phosphatase family protein [Corynebacterium sp.]